MSREIPRRDFLRLAGAVTGATLLLSGKTNPPTEAAKGLEDEKGEEILKDFFVVTGRVIDKETGEGIGTSHIEEEEVMLDGNGVIVQLRQIVGQNEAGLPVEKIINQTVSGTHLPGSGSFLLHYQGKETQIKKDLEENRLSVAVVDSSLRTLKEIHLITSETSDQSTPPIVGCDCIDSTLSWHESCRRDSDCTPYCDVHCNAPPSGSSLVWSQKARCRAYTYTSYCENEFCACDTCREARSRCPGFVGSVEELVIEISAKTKNNR